MSADTLPSATRRSDTPRTDAALGNAREGQALVDVEFARQLEHELERMTEIATIAQEQLKVALSAPSQSASMHAARCACGRTTPHGIVPEEDCKAAPCLFTPSSTQESYSAALTAKAGEDFETWWKRYRTNVVRRTEREIARDAWLAFAASATAPRLCVREDCTEKRADRVPCEWRECPMRRADRGTSHG